MVKGYLFLPLIAIEIKRYLFLEGLYHVHEQGLPCSLHLVYKGRCFVARCLGVYHYMGKISKKNMRSCWEGECTFGKHELFKGSIPFIHRRQR